MSVWKVSKTFLLVETLTKIESETLFTESFLADALGAYILCTVPIQRRQKNEVHDFRVRPLAKEEVGN